MLANQYIDQGNVTLAIPLLNKSAEQGNANSLITLITLYANGLSLPKDEKKAQNYFRILESKNNSSKLFNYAIFLIQNAKNINDYKKAQTLLDQYHIFLDHHAVACRKFTEKMLNEKHILISCDAWIEDEPLYVTIRSLTAILAIQQSHSKNEIKKAIKELELFNKYYLELTSHLSQGLPSAFLAQLYIKGKYVPQDYQRAKDILENLLKYSLISQSREARYLLGKIYQQGLGIKKDNETAKKYYEEACSPDSEQACQALQTLLKKKPYNK